MIKKLQTIGLFLLITSVGFSQPFTEVALESGIDHVYHFGDYHFGGGVAVFDYNNDGHEDLYLTGGYYFDALYKNNGDGTFSNVTAEANINHFNLQTQGVTCGDINNDGFGDLFITVRGTYNDFNDHRPNLMYLNNGDGTFSDISESSNINLDTAYSTAAAFGDVNQDGYLDLYVGNFWDPPLSEVFNEEGMIYASVLTGRENFFYINNGDNTFTEAGSDYQIDQVGLPWAVTFSDYDNDFDVDLILANDFGNRIRPTTLFRNQFPETHFTNASDSAFLPVTIAAMGISPGDYNEDGWLDYYITNIGSNVFLLSQGDGTFRDRAKVLGIDNDKWELNNGTVYSVGWGANFMDYNNDSYLDLFISNGQMNPLRAYGAMDTLYNPNKLYQTQPDYSLLDVSSESGIDDILRGRGSVSFDYDNDGDLDILVVNQVNAPGYGENTDPKVRLFQNNSQSQNNWLKVKLQGTINNRNGFGARIRVVAGERQLIREVDGGSSHFSQNSGIAHFGLGELGTIDTLEVIWPGGARQGSTNIQTDQLLEVTENNFSGEFNDWGMAIPMNIVYEGLVVEEEPEEEEEEEEEEVITALNPLTESQIVLYPNPTRSNDFNIRIPDNFKINDLELKIHDLLGREIKFQSLQRGENFVSIQGLGGIVVYSIFSEKSIVKQGRIIVNR